jgi:proteasome lid subunit RPN8/RPN11
MKCSDQHLFTPVYLKLNDAMPWPEDEKAFHLLTSDGLFLCRNTPFFRSCVPVREFPSELAGQKPSLKLNYPRIPRQLMERVVGFFDVIGQRYDSEAAVLIAWNRTTKAVEMLAPDQVGLVGTSYYGNRYPMELQYEVPPLPPHLVLLGDIHSHVDGPAYASHMDKSDEAHRPGLHLVVGRILDEPPQFHCEATADGFRFELRDLSLILEGYQRRRVNEVPPEWIAKVSIKPWSSKYAYDSSNKTGSLSSSPTP